MSEPFDTVDQPELHARNLRVLEALLFASAEPVDLKDVVPFLSEAADVDALALELQAAYAGRGVNLVQRGSKWAFRTAEDLNFLLRREETDSRPLSRAALETLAMIAYHQPVTRADIEELRGVSISKGTLDVLMEAGWIRMRGRRRTPGRPVTYGTTEGFLDHFGLETLAMIAYHQPVTRDDNEELRGVSISKGTLDVLMEAGWIRMRGRRRTPGRPVTYGTTEGFLDHFGLETLGDLPGLDELKGAGLLSSRLPASFQIPLPHDGDLREDEDPLDPDDQGEPESDESGDARDED